MTFAGSPTGMATDHVTMPGRQPRLPAPTFPHPSIPACAVRCAHRSGEGAQPVDKPGRGTGWENLDTL